MVGNAYRDPVGILLSDLLAFDLSLLENVIFFVLKFHCDDDGTQKSNTDSYCERANDGTRLLENKRWRTEYDERDSNAVYYGVRVHKYTITMTILRFPVGRGARGLLF